MHVLVCDDDAALRFVARRWLATTLGCVVSECADGVEALGALAQQNVDLLLLDLELPRMSGVEVVEAIRESGTHADLPIVVLSNERRLSVIRQVVSLGVSDYLLKPLRSTAVRDRIGAVLARARRGRRTSVAVTRHLGPDTAALLVDGDANFRHAFVSVAETFGAIATAESGADAAAAFRASPAELVFVGTDLGIVGAASMMRKMRDVSVLTPAFISVGGLDAAAAKAAGFDGTIERSYQPGVLREALKPFVKHAGPLTELHDLAPGFEHNVDSAMPQVLGMMADVAIAPVEGVIDLPATGIVSLIQTEVNTFSVKFAIAMTDEMAAAVAVRMIGCEPAEVDEETARSTVGEIANMVTGRVDAWLKSRGLTCSSTLPDTRAVKPEDLVGAVDAGEGFVRGYALATLPGAVVLRVQAARRVD